MLRRLLRRSSRRRGAEAENRAGASLTPTGVPAPDAADAATIAEVLAFEKDMEAAVVRGDVKFLDRALTPISSSRTATAGRRAARRSKWTRKRAGSLMWRSSLPPYIYRELDHVQVELHGNVALTIGRYLYLPQSNTPQAAKEHLYVWFERVYIKQNGEWKHASHRTVKGPVREADEPAAN